MSVAAQLELVVRESIPVEETWDLSGMYADVGAWEAELGQGPDLIAAAEAFRGRLGESPAVLREAIEAHLVLRQVLERLNVFAHLTADEDLANSEARGRVDRATALGIEAGQRTAWFDPELLALPEERLTELLAAPELAPYRHYLDDIVRNRPHVRTPEVEELLALSYDVARGPRDSFMALDNADLTYGRVHDESGAEVELTKGRYQLLLDCKDRSVRAEAYDVFNRAYLAHRHTLGSLHAASVRKDVFYARARRFPSARAAALFANAISESVYDNLIAATRAYEPTYAKYIELRRRILDIEMVEAYDTYLPIAPVPDRRYTYPEAVEIVLTSLAPLGEDYVEDLRRGLTSERWVDIHETKGKRSGAYSSGAYGHNPVILLNWNGTVDHVYTLTHEAGHAMHSYYADRAQLFHDAQYPIFTAEVASTLNEMLLTWHLLDTTPEDEAAERFALLNRLADSVYLTHVRQVMFAEFEHQTHARLERGETLTPDDLDALFNDLYPVYLPGVGRDERTAMSWGRIPHFYSAFYVYQYATGLSAGIALARAIREEGEPAARRFRELLSAGGSDYPLELLRRAGVDLETPEPVESALQELDRAVDEMLRMVESGAVTWQPGEFR